MKENTLTIKFSLKYEELTIFWHGGHLYYGIEWEVYWFIYYVTFDSKLWKHDIGIN